MAAEAILNDYPELKPFVLSTVRLTGIRIGAGAFGSVEEVAIPGAICAAKKIHDIFLDRSEIPGAEISRASAQFVKECQLMSTLHHPNIVQFLGVCFFPGSRLPALVMERLLTSLHDLLDPETDPLLLTKPLFPLGVKCSILHNVACGLAYLHELSPPVIHRDLSARNVLLTAGMVAKIIDLGVARIVPRMSTSATMTKGPGASVFMPPEAFAPASSNNEKSKYNESIDIFSFGVVTMFSIGEKFPCDPLAPTYLDEESGLLVARTELLRRSEYIRCVIEQLRAYGQISGDHPLIRLIQKCLHNLPAKRPGIREVLSLLEEARAHVGDEQRTQAFQTQVSEGDYESRIHELEQQLQSGLREKEAVRQQLTRKEAELARADEIIRREQQQIQEMRQGETELLQAKDREMAQVQQRMREKINEKEERLQDKERQLIQMQQQIELLTEQMDEKDELVSDMHCHIIHITVELQQKAEQDKGGDNEEDPCLEEQLPRIPEQQQTQEEKKKKPIESPKPVQPDSQLDRKKIPVPKPRVFSKSSAQKEVQKKKSTPLEINKIDLDFGELLGEGGGGTVFTGIWKSKGIHVALKKVQLTPDHCDAKILAELGEHPNIISFFGFFHEHPDIIIVTALAKNGSLYQYLYKDLNVPTLEQSLRWARQTAYGMAHIHKLGIAHRDLKSSNILFTEDMEVQICDFGLSRSMPNTTAISKMAGTWRWMAPEIAHGKKINIMCDVFSFSMVVYELMEHQVPFHNDTDIMASMCIIKGERPQFTFGWPEYVAKLTEVGWSENPYQRPTFAEIITSLENKLYFRH